MHARYLCFVVGMSLATPATAQFRNEFGTVIQVDHDYPGLIASGHPCGAFVDQVAHRLNRRDGSVRWGRKARQADGRNANCDGLTYLNDPADRSRKTIVDVITNGPDPDRDDPHASPAWQEFPGDNVGNGFWTAPQTADRDLGTPPPPPPPVPPSSIDQKLDALQMDLAATHAEVTAMSKSLEEHRRVSREWVDKTMAFLKSPKTIAAVLGVLAGRFLIPGRT